MMDDTISRQDAIDVLETDAEMLLRVLDDTDIVGSDRDKFEWGLELIDSFISDMKKLPSAQRKGKWIYPYESSKVIVVCSECGARNLHGLNPYNYCPNCSADMR